MQVRSIPDLFMDVVTQLATLLRKEGELARTEVSEKVSEVAMALGLVIGGAVLLIPALVILLQAAVAALAEAGLSEPLAAVTIGGATLIIGVILGATGLSRLKADRLVPRKTIHQLHRDVDVAKEQARTDHERQQAA